MIFSTACSDKVLKITLHGKVQLELHCKDFLGKAVTVMFLLSSLVCFDSCLQKEGKQVSIKNEREHKNGVIRACLKSPHSSGPFLCPLATFFCVHYMSLHWS